MKNGVAKGHGQSHARPRNGRVPDGLKRDALDELGDKDPDVAGGDECQHSVVGDAVASVEQDTEVEDQDSQLGEREAQRVEEEAVPLLLRGGKSA